MRNCKVSEVFVARLVEVVNYHQNSAKYLQEIIANGASFMRTIFLKIYSLELAYQIYFFSASILLIHFALLRIWPSEVAFLAYVGAVGFGMGFSIWSFPSLRRFWVHPAGILVISIAQFFVYLLATFFARHLVATALGLPAQDFDLTVNFLTMLFYIPAAVVVVLFAATVAAAFFQVRLVGSALRGGSFLDGLKESAHFAGVIAFLICTVSAYDLAMKNQFLLHPLAKWIAFQCDYEFLPKYPAIDHNAKVRLHENGVVSQAELKGGNVIISVGSIQQ